jgi:hypothetical protein
MDKNLEEITVWVLAGVESLPLQLSDAKLFQFLVR